MRTQDLLDFVNAIAEAYPEDCAMDRFGRYIGVRNTDHLRKLAVKYKIGSCSTTEEQAGRVARAIRENSREIAAIIGDGK